MVCPRCSLPFPKNALACARCGETPRAVTKPIHTRPNAEGPRPGGDVSQQVKIDRRGAGVRVIDTPYSRPGPPRRRAPHWERSTTAIGRSSGHLYVPTPPPADPSTNNASVIYSAKTDPNWIDEPKQTRTQVPSAPAEPEVRLGSFWRRAVAWGLDAGFVGLTTGAAMLVGLTFYGWTEALPLLHGSFDEVLDGVVMARQLWIFAFALSVLLSFVYNTLSHGLIGSTLGQHLLHLRVETKDGEEPRLSDCAWRAGFSFVSLALGGLGVVWALFDPKGLAMHDRLVGTRVVRTDPLPPPAVEEPKAIPEEKAEEVTEEPEAST